MKRNLVLFVLLLSPVVYAKDELVNTFNISGFGLNPDLESLKKKYPKSEHIYREYDWGPDPRKPDFIFKDGKQQGAIPNKPKGTDIYEIYFSTREKKDGISEVSWMYQDGVPIHLQVNLQAKCVSFINKFNKLFGSPTEENLYQDHTPPLHQKRWWGRKDMQIELNCNEDQQSKDLIVDSVVVTYNQE